MLNKWKAFSILGSIFVVGCSGTVTQNDLPGNYVAEYPFAIENVTLRSDGHFTQTIILKTNKYRVTTNGTWNFREENAEIIFDTSFMVVADGFGQFVTNFNHPRDPAISILPVRRYRKSIQIGIDPGVPYIKRESS